MRPLRAGKIKNPEKMSSYWKREWRVVALIVLTGTFFNAALSLGPILQGQMLDQLLAGAGAAEILRPVAVFLLTIGVIQGMRFCKRYYVRVFANRTSAAMRRQVYHNLMHRDMSALSDEKIGDLMTKAISDVDACVEGMRKCTTEVFDTGVLMLSYLMTLFYYDVGLTLCACALLPVALLLAEQLKKIIFRYTKAYREQLSAVSQRTYERVEHEMLYRVYSAETENLRSYRAALAALEAKAVRATVLENAMQPIYNVIALTGVVAIVCRGGGNVIDGLWSVGVFSAYLTLFTALALKASKAAKLFNAVQKAQVSWQRIRPYLEEALSPPALPAQPAPAAPALCVEQLSFAYPGASTPVLRDVCFTAQTGTLLGVTGPVAGGKSTLGLALLGLYPYGGHIRLRGQELRTCPRDTHGVSYLGHDSQLLSDTIYHNITLGDDGDILPVLRDVCFEADLREMPLGIETMVGASGVRLSGGQQARLALARALYHRQPILVLDDPFSAVDAKTEREILAHLKERYHTCVILLISHRVAHFAETDAVLLVENGSAICATHAALLQTSETYRALLALQTEVPHA